MKQTTCAFFPALILPLALLIASCAPAPPTALPARAAPTSAVEGVFPLTVTDDADRQVTISRQPERIVSIAPSNTEIVFALGLSHRVVGVDQFSNYPPEARQKTQLGSFSRPDLEQIVAANPDLILAAPLHVRTVVPELEGRRLTVVVLDPKNLDDVLDRIQRVGQMTGQDARAADLVRDLRARTDAVVAKVIGAPRPKVFVELSPQLHTAGPDSFVDDLVRRAGGENVAGDADTQWPQLSQEVLVQKDPDVVVLADGPAGETPATVRARPGWSQLSAVKSGRILLVDPDLVSRAGPRVVDGLEELARALHPDRFS